MAAPDTVKRLVERFDERRDAYRSGRYNETQLRREFLDPFFEALSWDVFKRQGYPEMYKDVIHEDSLEIQEENRALDYAVREGRPKVNMTPEKNFPLESTVIWGNLG